MDAGKDDYMPTTRQHFVPKSYLKAWETSVRNSHEPTKRFEGVYVFTDKAGKGEGRNTKSILWSQSLYTVTYDRETTICLLIFGLSVSLSYLFLLADSFLRMP